MGYFFISQPVHSIVSKYYWIILVNNTIGHTFTHFVFSLQMDTPQTLLPWHSLSHIFACLTNLCEEKPRQRWTVDPRRLIGRTYVRGSTIDSFLKVVSLNEGHYEPAGRSYCLVLLSAVESELQPIQICINMRYPMITVVAASHYPTSAVKPPSTTQKLRGFIINIT